jgi:parallel beta-helix repeat protein
MYACDDGYYINVGTGTIRGVQFISGGQYDTLGSAFGIVNTIAGGRMTTLSGSSFQNCHDYCIYISNSNQATIDNNYFFVGQKYIVYAENSINYVFTNNVLVGARNRSSMIGSFMGDDIACYSQYTSLNWE